MEKKVIIVTGAGSGIGSATADHVAGQGATVAVADINDERAQRVAGRLDGAFPIQVDVTDVNSVKRMVVEVLERVGQIDALVNNVGWDKIEPFLDSDEALWDRLLAVNLKSQIACAHAVLPQMIEQKSGRIICVASEAGRVGSSGEVVYSAAKGGVIAFAKALAREVACYGIKVNAIAPGPTDTPLLRQFGSTSHDGILEAMVKATPLRRLAQPEDIAGAIAFLLSSEAGFITGQTLSVSGGLTMA